MLKLCISRCVIILCIIAVCAQQTFGQQEKQSSLTLDEITVTANKRKENIQEVPVAVTTLTETDLEDAGVLGVEDVIDFVPNMTFKTSFNAGVFETNFRGLRLSQFTGKNPVVIYIDGIAQDTDVNYGTDIFNVERVEVLRGSQGTLYGKNAIGGVINIISKKPGNTFDSKVTAETAEYGTYRFSAYSNGPVVKDRLFFGLSGTYYETDGYMDNDDPAGGTFDGQERSRFQSRLRWLPTDRLEMNFHAGISQKKYDSNNTIDASTGEVSYHASKNPDDFCETDSFDSALNIGYETDSFDVTSITSYSHSSIDMSQDQRYVNMAMTMPVASRDAYTDIFSQELRIQSPENKEGIKWIGGLYYTTEKSDWDKCGMIYQTKAMLGYDTFYNWADKLDDQVVAGFGEVTFPLPGRLAFTVGLRYERTHKEMDYRYEVVRADTMELLPADPFGSANPVLVTYNVDDDWDALLPKGVLSWTVNKNAMIYASVSQGYLAGGFNWSGHVKEEAKFDEQTSVDYELGAKTSWFDNRLILNANLFYMDIKDMHVYYAPDPVTYITSNAGEAHSTGAEIELRALPVHGLDIRAALGIVQAEYDEYINTSSNDCSGNMLEGTPDYTLNLAVQYRFDSGLYLKAGMQAYGAYYFNDANTISQRSVEIYNAKIGYERDGWDLYLYVDNMFDEEYFSYGRESASGITGNVGQPQTFGILASLRF